MNRMTDGITNYGALPGSIYDQPPEESEAVFVPPELVVPEFLRTLVFARPRGDDQFADCTFSPSLDMSR